LNFWGAAISESACHRRLPLPVRQTETEVAHAAKAEKREEHFSRTYAPNHHHHNHHNAVEKHLEMEL